MTSCANCQGHAFDVDTSDDELRCLDCLAITNARTGQLIGIDGVA